MQLALRFVAAVTAAALAAMLAHSYFLSRSEQALFEAEHEHDMQIVQALEATLESILEMQGAEAVGRVIADANRRAVDASFRVVAVADLVPEAESAVRGGRAVTLMRPDAGGRTRQLTYVPLMVGKTVRGALELSESMAVHDRFKRRQRITVALTTLFLLALTALAVTAMGLRVSAETDRRIAALEHLRHTDRLTTMGQLASGVAHELGTPLNVIALRAKMVESAGDGEVAASARIIDEQATRMTGIIRQLLDFSRRHGPRLCLVRLRDVVARTLDLLAPVLAKSPVQVDVHGAAEPLLVRADENQMQQVLTNVIMNAMQAMPGGGRLGIRLVSRHGRGAGAPENTTTDWAGIAVEDQGAGIAREHLGQIFEPFFTTKGVGEGTGLGLAVAYGIVQEHGGWIEVASEVGRGSRFTVWLARAAADEGARVEQAS
jgi:signal transduction histidine kinase